MERSKQFEARFPKRNLKRPAAFRAQPEPKRTKLDALPELTPENIPKLKIRSEVLAAKEDNNCKKSIGLGVSRQGGLETVFDSVGIQGGESLAFMTGDALRLELKPLEQDTVDKFRQQRKKWDFKKRFIVPHTIETVNIASDNPSIRHNSVDRLVADCELCDQLHIRHFVLHPGNHNSGTRNEGLRRAARTLDKVCDRTKDSKVRLLIEMSPGCGTELCSEIGEMKNLMERLDKPERIGVCIDTCHPFSAGYDLRRKRIYKKFMRDFEESIGIQKLKAIHLNDSKSDFNSRTEHHETIGSGFIGLRAFRNFINDDRLDHVPMILETGDSLKHFEEIIALYNLQK